MGLDKWLKSEDELKKSQKKKPSIQLTRYTLVCPNAKCKYQKTIMKKLLSEMDKICPRCNKEMKVKKN